jgi:hypothetical protein
MSLSSEDYILSASSFVQWVILSEQQVKILRRFAKEEAFHAISLLTLDHIAQVRPTASSPTTSSDVPKRHLANVEVVWVVRGLIQIVRALNEFWAASPMLEMRVDVATRRSDRR